MTCLTALDLRTIGVVNHGVRRSVMTMARGHRLGGGVAIVHQFPNRKSIRISIRGINNEIKLLRKIVQLLSLFLTRWMYYNSLCRHLLGILNKWKSLNYSYQSSVSDTVRTATRIEHVWIFWAIFSVVTLGRVASRLLRKLSVSVLMAWLISWPSDLLCHFISWLSEGSSIPHIKG